mmetsp:Transcript_9150/g.22754  ORF Transcript_9150/g.22754 Transcript_9150/m.22754 type:complete len:226 (-) Transcript_9150:62-739(-)
MPKCIRPSKQNTDLGGKSGLSYDHSPTHSTSPSFTCLGRCAAFCWLSKTCAATRSAEARCSCASFPSATAAASAVSKNSRGSSRAGSSASRSIFWAARSSLSVGSLEVVPVGCPAFACSAARVADALAAICAASGRAAMILSISGSRGAASRYAACMPARASASPAAAAAAAASIAALTCSRCSLAIAFSAASRCAFSSASFSLGSTLGGACSSSSETSTASHLL